MGTLRVGFVFAVVLATALVAARPAPAFEFFDGRLQVHGFFETQMRAIAKDFEASDDWDLTQWYNILNVEIEADIAPDGFGPFDLISAFVRLEARYDCVWTRACGLARSANVYGDRAVEQPGRYNRGKRAGFRSSGNVFNGDQRKFRNIPREFLPFQFSRVDPFDVDSPQASSRRSVVSKFFDIQGIDTLYDNTGVDQIFGTNPLTGINDDPAPFYFDKQERNCRFNFRDRSGSQNGVGNQVMLWSPKCKAQALGALAGKPDPLSNQDFSPITGTFGGPPTPPLPFRPQALNQATYAPTDPEVLSGQVAAGSPRPFVNRSQSQGVYFPNMGVVRQLQNGGFDDADQNYRQAELEWNRGASQQDEKELKEAYLDMELFDSRLWLRAGRQQIVWGKTELFRNQDLWNPQDLALASLPSLEESRISQWSVRGVWSFYEVGPFEDVRLELAMLWNKFEPTDIGRCGEPYTPNPACDKTAGLFFHGLTGFGVAGEVRPPDPWDDLSGTEIGARVEWRWSRFSFALTNYYGYDDLPYQDQLFVYSRNADPSTGAPRRGMSRGGCDVTVTRDPLDDGRVTSITRTGADCLTPANALAEHPVNQQLFRFICATSIGFTALDPNACGQSVFNSQRPALGPLTPAVSIALSAIVSGQPNPAVIGGQALYGALAGGLAGGAPLDTAQIAARRSAAGTGALTTPLIPLSNDGLALNNGQNGGTISTGNPLVDISYNPIIAADAGLEPYLTDQQQALLGCGPYYSTRCDVDGIDLMNAEASALFQSFPGFEGTFAFDWDATDASLAQPGTVGFEGGTPCGRFLNGQLVKLPGCRGPGDPGYDPAVDGTLIGLDNSGGVPLRVQPFTNQPFQSEMAVLSWNALMGLVAFSGAGEDPGPDGIPGTPDDPGTPATPTLADFDPTDPFRTDGCSYAKVQYCSTVQAFFQITGVQRNTVNAGGNGRFGRRDFVWHGGRDVALRYQKRNVLGFSADFAEDRTKSNWGIEFTWQNDLIFADNDSFDGLQTGVDTYNLTISVDRPTFINFLNANRTFFLNAQLFTQYVDGYKSSFLTNGPWNFLGVFVVETGYFDDRLIPRMTFVYDKRSNSGAWIPQFTYRFSSDFAATLGVALFTGREETRPMALSPTQLSNRVGSRAYKDVVENGLSAVRDRDEVFLRLRYTF